MIWDFNFPLLSPYNKKILEANLTTLGEMAHAEHSGDPEKVEKLTKTLHPDFQERLKTHISRLRECNPSVHRSADAEAILRTQTEICTEVLLHAIHDQDWTRVSELLNQITWIDPANNELYTLLWQICGMIHSDRWGEHAFHNRERYHAATALKIEAVVRFKRSLEARWAAQFLEARWAAQFIVMRYQLGAQSPSSPLPPFSRILAQTAFVHQPVPHHLAPPPQGLPLRAPLGPQHGHFPIHNRRQTNNNNSQ
jgi:hypothetical protein